MMMLTMNNMTNKMQSRNSFQMKSKASNQHVRGRMPRRLAEEPALRDCPAFLPTMSDKCSEHPIVHQAVTVGSTSVQTSPSVLHLRSNQ